MKITEKEEMVLREILKGSNFCSDTIDLTKSYDEQRFESSGFYAIADTRDYGCGMNYQQVRAIFGSLDKKKLISLAYDDGEDETWIIIKRTEFENIKKVLG